MGEGRPARAERELLDMECLSYTDTSTLLAMMDCMVQNLSTTQTFQYIGDFVLYIMEVRYMLYPDELAYDVKLIQDQSEKESMAPQVIRIVQPTPVYYELMNNLFLLLVTFSEVDCGF